VSHAGSSTGFDFELRREPGDGGRFATLVYSEGERRLEVELERAFDGAAEWQALDAGFCEWCDPAGLALEPEHVDRVLARMGAWSLGAGLRIELVPAVDPLVELLARGFTLARNPDGSVIATPPESRVRGFLTALFRR
jgi:hypothetical protein